MGKIRTMVDYAVGIARDDSHGYSWADRWDVDRDCSSLMYDSANFAGYDIGRGPSATRYTGTMIPDFTAAGFSCHDYGTVELTPGCILLRDPWGKRGHTEIYIGNGQTAGAHIAETGGVYGQPGDQTGHEISVEPDPGDWDYVLVPPADIVPHQDPGTPFNDSGLRYRAHVENLGDLDWVHDGQTAGTTGFALRMEALEIEPPAGVELRIKGHVQDLGWNDYGIAKHGEPLVVGTKGKALRIECIIVEVVKNGPGLRLEYQVHEENTGWKGITPAGFATGSDGQRRRLEAIRMWMV